ncbi:PDZ and LIM domain protein 2-like [Leptonychotes weddellii]|uniref:PDZ and LIM domain protein 2-like n=1 Tax=Leptonychotes weddellii TaxID=9713 RepID=A0A7F8QBX5_LEPWE|nr:PDZ and LIM domain protein 2-like [Leptonychotes weddellii]
MGECDAVGPCTWDHCSINNPENSGWSLSAFVNHAVRIQEGRYRHPGCYTCADCGLNLKMRGHFWVGDELYCEKHARQRYSSPPTLSSQA